MDQRGCDGSRLEPRNPFATHAIAHGSPMNTATGATPNSTKAAHRNGVSIEYAKSQNASHAIAITMLSRFHPDKVFCTDAKYTRTVPVHELRSLVNWTTHGAVF
jgi:hypothetical protein